MSDDGIKINISLEQFDNLRNGKKELELKVAKLEADLAKAQLGGDASVAEGLVAMLRDAIKIVQWSQGNYDPETVRGWPYLALRALATAIKSMPGATIHEIEWATDSLQFAKTAEVLEIARKEGRQQDLGQAPRGLNMPMAYAAATEKMLAQQKAQQQEKEQLTGGGQQQPSPVAVTAGVVQPSPTTVPAGPAPAPAVTSE